MKKILTILVLLVSCVRISNSQGNIKKISVQEKGFNLDVKYFNQQKTIFISNGLNIDIEPVDPSSLNVIMMNSSILNGEYKYTFIDRTRQEYFLKKKKGLEKSSNYLESIYTGLDWLISNNIINEDDYNKLNKEIQIDYNEEDENTGTIEIGPYYNPYYWDTRYLSTFQIILANTTKSPIAFSNKFEILDGNNLLVPLRTREIINLQKSANTLNSKKEGNLLKFNLDSITIPANSTSTKYFSTLPIDFSNESFEVILNETETQKSVWKITKNKTDINNQYSFYELIIYPTSWTYNKIYTIIRNSGSNAFIAGRNLYVDENEIDKELSIFVYAIYDNKSYYFPFKFFPKDYLDFVKKKRKMLPIDLIQIKTE